MFIQRNTGRHAAAVSPGILSAAAAQRDLHRAQALAPEAAFGARNMAAIRAHQNTNSPATAAATLATAHE